MTVPSVFISYSHRDEIWKDRLKPHLRMLQQAGKLTIWDDRRIDAGETWYDEIKEAMEDAEVAVCLISADYLASDFCIKEEIPYLLERRKSAGMVLMPVLIRQCLWEEIEWLKNIQMLPRDGKAIATDFREDWDTPFTQVAKAIVSIPEKSTRELFIAPPKPLWSPPEKVDVDRLPVTGSDLFGRQNELKLLDETWETGKVNVISFVAWGGVGKSTLVNKWREQLAADNYRGAKRVYAWSFYSQGTGERVTSADLFIAEALKWFGDEEMANSSASPWDKGQRLADLVKQEKTLLILDGMEPLQSYLDFERGKIKDPALAVLVTELAEENPGLCVITTREKVIDLVDFPETKEVNLEQISAEAGRALLRIGGVQGTDAELEQAARDFGLHAFAIKLLAAYLYDTPGHKVSNTSEIPGIVVPEAEGKHPRRVMAAFEKRFGDSPEVNLLRILGLFSSPANEKEIEAVRLAPPIPNLTEHLQVMSEAEWLGLVNTLRRVKLIASESNHRPDTLDAHPLVREHFGKQLKQEFPSAWREGNNRLYEYYKSTAKDYPDTLEEMAPLYAAVLHGCQAGKYQEAYDEVYRKRIRRGNEQYSLRQLGAFGADLATLSGFFAPPWYHPITTLSEDTQSWLLSGAGYRLRALGRLTDAAQPIRAALKGYIAREDWGNAARQAINLSDLFLILGDLTQALAYAEQSVQLADRSGDEFMHVAAHPRTANAFHQAGRLAEAGVVFRQAEELQKKRQPELPLLYSDIGYQYCNLLLSQDNYAEVEQRAAKGLEIVLQGSRNLLDIALNNLSLGRTHLLRSQREPDHSFTESIIFLNHAVDGLRQAGRQDMLPLGFLARAEYYRVTKDFGKAKRDLDEAFKIATRGGMGLHLTDCHLEYARLYLAKGEKERAREHWQIAKDSIEKMGYHRRDREVKELEEKLS